MDSLAPHRTVVALTLDEPRLHTRRPRLVVLMGLGVMLLAFALMAVSASAAQAYTVSGTVTAQATGSGIAEAAVTVTEATTGIEVASAITNFAGNYSLEVPAGTYDISFTPPVGSGFTSTEDRGEAVLANRTIDVELAPLSGSVTFSGVLFGEGGVRLPGVAIVLEASGSAASVARTASDGSFSVTVAPGTYSMVLEDGSLSVGNAAPGNFVFSTQPVTISGNLHEDLTLPVHMLTVRALEANGNPVSGVSISGLGSSAIVEGTGTLGPGITVSSGQVVESATTGADGTAVFSVPDFTGNPTFEVRPPENTPLVSTTLSVAGVNEDQTREVTLPPGVTFSGVLFGEGGVRLPGVAIVLEASGSAASVARTASDGSFSVTVAPGTYSMVLEDGSLSVGNAAPGNFVFSTQPVTISGNLHEDLTLPVHMLTVRALEANGNPVPGVTLEGGASSAIVEGTGTLGPGITVSSGQVVESATTGADGTAVFSVPDFTGNPTFEVRPPENTPLVSTTLSVAGVNEDQTREVTLPPGVTFSGVLFGEGGVRLPGVAIVLEASGSAASVARTASDGSFSVTVAPGTYSMVLEDGSLSVGNAAPGNFVFSTQPVTISGNLHEDLTLPVHMLTVRALEANGNPVPGVTLEGGASSAIVEGTGTLGPGIVVSSGDISESTTTGADGTAVFSVPDFTGNPTFEVRPPENTPLVSTTLSVAGVNEDQTRLIAYPNYARVTSAGASGGTVEIASPPETTLSAVSDEQAKEAGLPEGAVAVVGSVSYTVSGLTAGGSINVTMQLPPGSEPTNVFKLINGSYVDVTSLATISGNTITLHLTDGGLGDADGVANGVIVDPVVPVHITKHSQAISFTSTAPSSPNIGSVYAVAASATSGLPVSFSIDGSSTAGACSVSAGTVSFTGVGTCIIDASQVGNEAYLPAPQQQQTVEVVKGSQTISFTSTGPAKPVIGGKYMVGATASSGLPVSFSIDGSSTAGACSVSGGTVLFTGAGSCVIDANQVGNEAYLPAPQKQQTVEVVKDSQTISFTSTAPAKPVIGGKYMVGATASSGLPVGFSIDGSSTAGACSVSGGTVLFTGAGSCVIDASQSGDATYLAAPQVQQTMTVTNRTTSSGVVCSPGTVVVGQATSCTATVTGSAAGTNTTPSGAVAFSSDTSGGSFSSSGSCTLSATGTTGVASCSVSYTPGQVGSGTHKITASYGGDSAHTTSSGNTTVTVTKRSTATRVGCTEVKSMQHCTATVKDTAPGTATTPTGSVTFTSTATKGTFSPSRCTLSAVTVGKASCAISYKPVKRSQTITGRYSGDAIHAASSGSTVVTGDHRGQPRRRGISRGS